MADIKRYFAGDVVQLPYDRPSHWNKKGKMDKFLGQEVTITRVWDFGKGLQRFWFDGCEYWMFLNTDIGYKSPKTLERLGKFQSGYRPYTLPIDDILKYKGLSIAEPKPWEPEVGQIVTLMLPVKVMRDWGTKVVDICDDNGNCLQVSNKALTKIIFNKEVSMKLLKDAVLEIAKELAKSNNTFTTLEVKLQGRRDYPYLYWSQQVVSDFMNQYAGDGLFTYTDNGTYRTYSLATPSQVATTAGPVSKTLNAVPGPVKNSAIVNPTKKSRKKQAGYSIPRAQLLSMASNPGFQDFHLGNTVVTKSLIRSQKKSPKGYLTPSKINKVLAITVNGITYKVV